MFRDIKAQAQPPTPTGAVLEKNTANKTNFERLFTEYQNKLRAIWPPLKTVLDSLPAITTTAVYEDPQPALVYLKQLKALWSLLNGTQASIARVDTSSFPVPDQEVPSDFKSKYDAAKQADAQFRQLATPIFTIMRILQTAVSNAQNAGEEWVSSPEISSRINTLPAAVEVGRFLGLTGVVLPAIKIAYPLAFSYKKYPIDSNLQLWKSTASQISAFRRAYTEYTFPQVLYHFTKDWNMFERFNFKKWYNWTRTGRSNPLMTKYASIPGQKDFIFEDRLQKFEKKRKLLLSRVNLVRKALHDMINHSLIPNTSTDKIYKVLSMLEYEALNLSAPKVASARIRRASTQLQKLGFVEGSSILSLAATEMLQAKPLTKTAEEKEKNKDSQATIIEVLQQIKKEMDVLNYNVHLDTMYDLKKQLEASGRQSDADLMLKIIREDLDSLDKLNKKLTEIYTSLSKIPIQLSMQQDVAQLKPSSSKSVEVSEDEIEKPSKPTITTTQKAQTPSRSQAPTPTIQKDIPNV